MNRKGHLRGDKKPFKCPFLQFVRKKFAVCAKSYNCSEDNLSRKNLWCKLETVETIGSFFCLNTEDTLPYRLPSPFWRIKNSTLALVHFPCCPLDSAAHVPGTPDVQIRTCKKFSHGRVSGCPDSPLRVFLQHLHVL